MLPRESEHVSAALLPQEAATTIKLPAVLGAANEAVSDVALLLFVTAAPATYAGTLVPPPCVTVTLAIALIAPLAAVTVRGPPAGGAGREQTCRADCPATTHRPTDRGWRRQGDPKLIASGGHKGLRCRGANGSGGRCHTDAGQGLCHSHRDCARRSQVADVAQCYYKAVAARCRERCTRVLRRVGAVVTERHGCGWCTGRRPGIGQSRFTLVVITQHTQRSCSACHRCRRCARDLCNCRCRIDQCDGDVGDCVDSAVGCGDGEGSAGGGAGREQTLSSVVPPPLTDQLIVGGDVKATPN